MAPQIYLNMQEFQRAPCLYHPSQFITNFCKEKTCLMPLCPTCICSHLELHLKGGKSNPQFDNINDSFAGCSKEIKTFSQRFEDERNQLNAIERTIMDQKKELSDLIYKTKVMVRELVETTFETLEKEIDAAIDKQNITLGLHLPQGLDNLQKGIMDIGSKLREMNGDLRTDRSLSTLITFNHESRAGLEKSYSDITKEIKNNQEYAPVTSINNEALNRLKQAVGQMITLKFNFPQSAKQHQKTTHGGSVAHNQPHHNHGHVPHVKGHHQHPSQLGLTTAQGQSNVQGQVVTQVPTQGQTASTINPSLIQQAQSIDRDRIPLGKPSGNPLSSSYGSRPSGVSSPTGMISPTKPPNPNPSYQPNTQVGSSADLKYKTQSIPVTSKDQP